MLGEPAVLNREIEGAVLVYENPLGRPGKMLRSSVDLAFNYAALEGDDNLYCLNNAGRVLWKYQIPGGIHDLKVSVEGKFAAVSSNTGGMFYLDNTGKLLWSYSLGRAIPKHAVSPDGSIVVATTVPPSGKGQTLCIISKAGQVLRHLSVPYEIRAMGCSFDGSIIITGDGNHNVAQYTKAGDRQWIYSIRSSINDLRVSQSGLLIFALTSEIVSISPSGTERWRIRNPEGPVNFIRMSHDGSVNIACGAASIFRYDLKGKILWKHPMPVQRSCFLLSYRSYNIILHVSAGIEYWDKYGFSISTFHLPAAEATNEDCMTVSQDGRYIMYLDDAGVLRQMDMGMILARHLINASKIFLEELKRLGTVSQGAEENLQWAMESMNDGDVQYALSFGQQAYSAMETTLDSLPSRKAQAAPAPEVRPSVPAARAPAIEPRPQAAAPAPAGPAGDITELYKRGLREIFQVKDEPSEIEWNLLTILREAFNISPEQHNVLEEEVRSSVKQSAPSPVAPRMELPPSRPAPAPAPFVSPAPVPVPKSIPAPAPAAPSYVPKELEIEDEFEEARPVETPEPPKAERTEPFRSTPEPARTSPPISPRPPQFETPRPSEPPTPAPEPIKVEPAPAAQPAPEAPKPAEAPPGGSFTMDNYVSDILSKYLKK